jgi:aminoglycoside 6'-N-acetyltransferase
LVQLGEENWAEGRHGWIDIFVGDDFAGRGIGTAAVKQGVEMLLARGHHRVTIDPDAQNAAAIRCYEKAGFTRVGVTRSSWRGPGGEWSDELLMEFVSV